MVFLESDVFESLVRESYKLELVGKTLNLNNNIPRIVKRFEEAFIAQGLEFRKTRPARLFLAKMANQPSTVMVGGGVERFERLFQKLVQTHASIVAKGGKPFNAI